MLEKLEPRERLFVMIGGGALVVFLCILLFSFLAQKRKKVHKMVMQTRAATQTALRLKSQIQSMAPAQKITDKNQFMGRVSSLIESNQMKIRTMKDEPPEQRSGFVEHPIRISLSGVNLGNLIHFLHTIEYSTPARVRRLSINKQLSAKDVYDVVVVLVISLPKEVSK